MSARKMTPPTATMIAKWIRELEQERYEELDHRYAHMMTILLSPPGGATADDVAGALALTAAYKRLRPAARARWNEQPDVIR